MENQNKGKVLFITENQAKEMSNNIENINIGLKSLIKLYEVGKNKKVLNKINEYYANERKAFIDSIKGDINQLAIHICLLSYCIYTYQNMNSFKHWADEINTFLGNITKNNLKSGSKDKAIMQAFNETIMNNPQNLFKMVFFKFKEEKKKNNNFIIDVNKLENTIIPFFISNIDKLIEVIKNYQLDDDKEYKSKIVSNYIKQLEEACKNLK